MKTQIWDVGNPTPFQNTKLTKWSDNIYQVKNPLKRLLVPKSDLHLNSSVEFQIDYLFGKVKVKEDKNFTLSGEYFPINWDNPVIQSKEVELSLAEKEGYVILYDTLKEGCGLRGHQKYLLDYNLGDRVIRCWVKMSSQMASRYLSFDVIGRKTLADRHITLAYSDRFNI